jgi:hypothetical protein
VERTGPNAGFCPVATISSQLFHHAASREPNLDETAAWRLEERFWLEGSGLFETLLDAECLMALPGMGLMRAADVPASLEYAPQMGIGEHDRSRDVRAQVLNNSLCHPEHSEGSVLPG